MPGTLLSTYFELKSVGFDIVSSIRRFETRDIVKRVGVLSPSRVFINNYPLGNPPAIFNASIVVQGDDAIVFARVVLGYYMYVSAIATVVVPLSDILEGSVTANHYAAQVAVYPTGRYDVWGAEDPRVYEVDGKLLMTYVGRSINYFNPHIRRERTLPVTAVRMRNYSVWDKRAVHVLPPGLREHVVSDKDAFIARLGGRLLLFHRPHMDDEKPLLAHQ